ncbi:MAG: leucine-rich repeat domain-containing protein, partial [Planctomycetota bacterium]
MKRTLLIAVFFSLALCNYAAEPNEPPISPLNDLPKKVKAGEPQSQSVNDEKTSSNKSVQKITPRHDLVDPIIIVYSAYYMDGGTQAFFLTDGAGKKRAISVDGRIEPGTQGRIYLGGHPTQGRLTTKDEERAYIDILKRAVEVYTPAQLAAMEEAIDKHALDDPHPVKEIAYVTAKEFLIQRLGPSYENYLKNHPSHKEAAKARESDEQSALKQAIKEQSDRAIIRFVQKYPDSKFVPDAIKHLQKFQYYPIKERRVLPYTVLPGFRDRRKGPGGWTINDVRMDFELKHGPWPKTTHFLKAENLGSITARQSDLNVATGGRIFFEQWALLGKMICKGTIEFSGEGLVLLPGTDVYLENGVIQGLRPDGGWLFESTAVQAEDYRWSENDNEAVAIIGYDGTCTITRYTGPGGDVSIPETLGVLTVTAIGDGAFEGCSSLTSVAIPDSVTTIGDEAFLRCSKLTGVTLGSSITTIGYDAFKNCSNLTSVIIPNSVTAIGSDAFRGCSSMASVTIPNSVTTV